ncbi:MAG TPA: hypothetical protein PK843_08715 [bacterium]|nr:hypothetical protein [bacterium]HPN34583.1 hypothetical protein [bacterium]
MKPLLTALLISASLAAGQVNTEPDSLNEHLRPFKPYLNKTYIGRFAQAPGQPPMQDIARWERILNGQAIRMLHSVNDGEYGGETILFWDKARRCLVYYYFTTAGFFTNGTMHLEVDKWVSHEMVTNNAHGITEVRSTSQFLPDGRMHTVSEFKQNGQWVHGHTIDYVESPESRMVFR